MYHIIFLSFFFLLERIFAYTFYACNFIVTVSLKINKIVPHLPCDVSDNQLKLAECEDHMDMYLPTKKSGEKERIDN